MRNYCKLHFYVAFAPGCAASTLLQSLKYKESFYGFNSNNLYDENRIELKHFRGKTIGVCNFEKDLEEEKTCLNMFTWFLKERFHQSIENIRFRFISIQVLADSFGFKNRVLSAYCEIQVETSCHPPLNVPCH